jgi:hypothetical protein
MRSQTCRTAFLWAPNEGVSYPYGSNISALNATEVTAMDTNKDGSVTTADDPYAPYYPGDSWVSTQPVNCLCLVPLCPLLPRLTLSA